MYHNPLTPRRESVRKHMAEAQEKASFVLASLAARKAAQAFECWSSYEAARLEHEAEDRA